MAIHFTTEELAGRRAQTCQALSQAGLDGLLMFRQESMFYLTGYDTFGYVFFQCLVLTADGRMVLLTRAPDLRQAQETSVLEDIRVWVDGPDAQPALELKEILAELGMVGKRFGVEYEAYGLTARNGKRLDATLEGSAELVDASELVNRQHYASRARRHSDVLVERISLTPQTWMPKLETKGLSFFFYFRYPLMYGADRDAASAMVCPGGECNPCMAS